jgi:hypothetical protein
MGSVTGASMCRLRRAVADCPADALDGTGRRPSAHSHCGGRSLSVLGVLRCDRRHRRSAWSPASSAGHVVGPGSQCLAQ